MPPRTPQERAVRLASLGTEFGEPLTFDGLTRDYGIFQRAKGHRHSTDDLLTAWYAIAQSSARSPTRLLDLGAGIGGVGLLVRWHFCNAALTCVEAQAISYRLLLENLWANGLESEVAARLGDLRDAFDGDDRLPEGSFDLVTGSPPYFDVRAGIVPQDSQKAHARFELRGDVSDYCRAARRALACGGRFVFCFPWAQRDRPARACKEAGLTLLASRDVVPRVGLAPLFSLYCARRSDDTDEATPTPTHGPAVEPPFIVREADGRHSDAMTAARVLFGMATCTPI